jgi:hypothetical protein
MIREHLNVERKGMKRNKNREAVTVNGAAGVRRELVRCGTYAGMLALACAGLVAGAILTRLLVRANTNRRWDRQVERFRAQGAL